MGKEELQFIFSLFSFVGVIGILFYLIVAKANADEQREKIEMLELKNSSLQDYIYKLDEQIESNKTLSESDIKQQIIEMYEEGKEVMVIENTLNIPRAKIEMVIKFYKLQKER